MLGDSVTLSLRRTLMSLSHASHRLPCAVVDHFPTCIDLQFDLDLNRHVSAMNLKSWHTAVTIKHTEGSESLAQLEKPSWQLQDVCVREAKLRFRAAHDMAEMARGHRLKSCCNLTQKKSALCSHATRLEHPLNLMKVSLAARGVGHRMQRWNS